MPFQPSYRRFLGLVSPATAILLSSACSISNDPNASTIAGLKQIPLQTTILARELDLDDKESPPDPSETEKQELVGQLCSPVNMIVRYENPTEQPSCPDFPSENLEHNDWIGEPLFTNTEAFPAEDARDDPLINRYCRYTWNHPSSPPGPDDILRLKKQLKKQFEERPIDIDVDPDCQAVAPQADIISNQVGDDFRALFHHEARRIDRASIEAKYPSLETSPVMIAVIDTLPHYLPPNPTSSHGPIVMNVIRDFACPDNSGSNRIKDCTVALHPFVGLPRDVDGTILKEGGYFGRQSDFARGIYAAVRFRLAHPEVGPLILNLSAGWEPGLFGGHPGARASVHAVYDALRYARTKGALIIAAAGNHNGIQCSEEALAPARWESEFVEVPDVGSVPLLYAVGGLGHDSSLMPGTRLDGLPRLFAPATHAVARHSSGASSSSISSELTDPRTGTSIAAAVVSGAAGLLWSYHSHLRADEIMDALYNTGHAIHSNERSDFGVEGPGEALHSIDICAAFDRMCGPNCGKQNPDLPLCSEPEPLISIADIAAKIQDLPVESHGIPDYPSTLHCEERCLAEKTVVNAVSPKSSCPQFQPPLGFRLTETQPGDPGCSDCTVGTLLYRRTNNSTPFFTVRLTVDESRPPPLSIVVDARFDQSDRVHSYEIRTLNADNQYETPELASDKLQSFDLPFPPSAAELSSATVRMSFALDDITVHTEDSLISH